MWRRRAAPLGLLLLSSAGCASVQPPPGGPEDREPPELVATRPDSLAASPGWRGPVVLAFDERISERGLDQAVEVSPRTSLVRVSHSGNELRVDLREGWAPATVYQVTVLPVVRDLFGNSLAQPIRLVFSTGAEIPDTRVRGQAVERVTGKAATDVRVEAIRTADSLVYATRPDSAGRFQLDRIPPGDYLLRAFSDLNRNRSRDPFEAADSAQVRVAPEEEVTARLSVVPPDSTAPRIASARLADGSIEVQFDDYLDPAQPLPPTSVQVRPAGKDPVPVARVAVGRIAAAADTLAADPLPARTLTVELAEGAVLAPGVEHTVTLFDIRNIVGLAATAETTLVPAPQP